MSSRSRSSRRRRRRGPRAPPERPPPPEPPPAAGEPAPAEPPRYEAAPAPAAAEEWPAPGYEPVESPAPADPFEPEPEPVGVVEPPVSEPVPDVEPVEVEAPEAYEWPPVPEPPPAYGVPPPAEPPRYEAVPPPAAAEEWLVRGYGPVETPAPAEPSEPVGVVEPPVSEVPVAAGPFEPVPEPVGVVEPPVSEPVPDVEPVEVEAPAVYEPPPFPEQPSRPTYEAPAPPVHEPPRPAYEAPAPSPPPAPPQPAYEAPPPPAPPQPAYEPPAQPPAPPPAYEAPEPPEPPRYEPPTTPAPDFAPMPGMPDLGPIEPETLAGPEAEAPPLPAFMPSVTDVSPSAEMPVEQVVASTQRALAGTAIGDAMMLWQLGRLRRRRGARRGDSIPDPLELSLEQTARMDSLRIIEAAMRHLRAVTIAQLRPKPRVVCVRTGTYGFEVLLDQPVEAPEGWQSVSGGYVLELPRGVTVEQLDAVGQGPSLCPALVPVGDTAEGPLLINIQEIGCLAVSGAGGPTASLLTSIVETLGSSPLAGDIRIITIGVNSPSGPGWERIHATRFDSPQLEHLLSTAHSPAHGTPGSFDVLVVGPGNDLLFQRAGQIATTPGSRLMLVGATSSAAARWPWRIHVDEHSRAVVHPIAVNIVATQAMRPELAYLLSEAAEGPQGTSRF